MRNFESFAGIDWSGAKSPIHTHSIAVSLCAQGRDAPVLFKQKWSRQAVFDWILEHLKTGRRTLIGIDANFGYAREIGILQFGKTYDYRDLWGAVEKVNHSVPNFFAGHYWAAHPEFFWTHGKQPAHIYLPKRITERQCAQDGYGRPESPFKLIGAKQVGKGGLAAMRMAHALKHVAGDKICIWPFERHCADQAQIVITEIYPRQFLMRTGHGVTKVNTLEDLNIALEKLESKKINETYRFDNHDADAIVSAAGLRKLCGDQKTLPEVLSNPSMLSEEAAQCEGWIFGVGDRG